MWEVVQAIATFMVGGACLAVIGTLLHETLKERDRHKRQNERMHEYVREYEEGQEHLQQRRAEIDAHSRRQHMRYWRAIERLPHRYRIEALDTLRAHLDDAAIRFLEERVMHEGQPQEREGKIRMFHEYALGLDGQYYTIESVLKLMPDGIITGDIIATTPRSYTKAYMPVNYTKKQLKLVGYEKRVTTDANALRHFIMTTPITIPLPHKEDVTFVEGEAVWLTTELKQPVFVKERPIARPQKLTTSREYDGAITYSTNTGRTWWNHVVNGGGGTN